MPTNQHLNAFFVQFLKTLYQSRRFPRALVETLALLLTGVFLGRHVQLWELALWAPQSIQLTSVVRRFARFLADPRVEVRAWGWLPIASFLNKPLPLIAPTAAI